MKRGRGPIDGVEGGEKRVEERRRQRARWVAMPRRAAHWWMYAPTVVGRSHGGVPGLWRVRGRARGRPPRSPNGRRFPSATTTKAGTACFGQTQGRWWCAFGRWRAEGHRRADRGGVMAGRAGLVRVASTASWAPWEPLCASTSIWRPSATGGARFIG